MEFLKSISLDFQIVKGEFDRDFNLPLSLVFNYDKLKIGILNGFSIIPQNDPLSLLTQARLMDVDILISGGTHKLEAYVLDGKFFINPGSATGVYSTNPLDDEDLNLFNSLINEKKLDSLKKSQDNDNTTDNKKDNETDIKDESEEKSKIESNESNESNTDTNTESTVDKSTDLIDKESSTEDSNKEATKENKDEKDLKEIKKDEDDDEIDDDLMEAVEPYISSIPSFCLLDIQGSVCTLYLYTLIDGEVKVDKVAYRKEEK
ncbi:unnamed protein product [[Candida] boidinii]|nr:unnamed protein product [[Candida] boidinii]